MPSRIIARLKDHSFVTIFEAGNSGLESVSNAYQLPTLTEEQTFFFDPEKSLENDEWFYVQPNETQRTEIIQPYLDTVSNIDNINPISSDDYPNIRAICLVSNDEDANRLILTKIFPRFYTMTRKLLKWEDGPSLETQSRSIDFTAKVDAFWRNDKLYFRSYTAIKSVFTGLSDFYRVATEEEKNSFLGKNFFDCEDKSIKVRQRNLRKIAAIMDNIPWNNPDVRASYIDYANNYSDLGIEITDDSRMKIESNNDLTKILYVLEERLYTTPITGQRRGVNSTSPIDEI